MNPREAKLIKDLELKDLFLPKKIQLAVNLINAFIKNNNLVGLKIAILLSGGRHLITYDKNNRISFDVDKLCKLIQVDKRTLSRNKRKIIDTTYEYVWTDGSSGVTKPINTFEYSQNNKKVFFEISLRAKQLFTELGKGGYQFTNALSDNLMRLKHKHSLRMQLFLENLNAYTNTVGKRKKMNLQDMNEYFGVNYTRWIDIERKILIPVKNEITLANKLTFIYEFESSLNQGTGRPKFEYVVIDLIDNRESLFAQ